jgi:hypothetical protein
MYTLMRSETTAITRAKVVVIKTIPLWSVAVMTAIGADWPGKRELEFESMMLDSVRNSNCV